MSPTVRTDGAGLCPGMVVALLLYAYARRLRSSRVIERACEEDVAFRVLAAQQRPDHATVARLIIRNASITSVSRMCVASCQPTTRRE